MHNAIPAEMNNSDQQRRIHEALDSGQSAATRRIVVYLPVASGLGGQIDGRVQSLALALALDRKAVFLTTADPPYGQTFEAMHPAMDIAGDYRGVPTARLDELQADDVVCYDPARMSLHGTETDRVILEKISQRLGFNIASRQFLEGCIFNWMKPTSEVMDACERMRRELGVGRETLGVHFRRGDKAVETAFVPAAEFNRRIVLLHREWPFATLYLASDSPDAASEIQCPAGVQLIFDAREQRYNNANHKMLLGSPHLVRQETIVAFKNIFLLASCGGVVGQDNAHFARLAAASIVARDGRPERIILVDGRFAEKASVLVDSYFRIKKQVRALGRRLLPHLTASARMRRGRRN
jgi:hypothetical protein